MEKQAFEIHIVDFLQRRKLWFIAKGMMIRRNFVKDLGSNLELKR